MLGECGTTDPAVIELRGKARAALGDLDGAREQLQLAAGLWQQRGDGLRAQESRAAGEAVRRALLQRARAQGRGAGRLLVLDAAPLVAWAPAGHSLAGDRPSDGDATRASPTGGDGSWGPVAFPKRAGVRCWRALLEALSPLGVSLQVQLEILTRRTLAAALDQQDRPMLHLLPAPDYAGGLALEADAGELSPLPLEELRAMLAAAPSTPSLVFLTARGSEPAGRAFLEAGCETVVALRGFLPEADVTAFSAAFYTALLRGAAPREAFEAASASLHAPVAGGFVLIGAAASLGPLPPPGELIDVSPKLCPWNLPYVTDDGGSPSLPPPAAAAAEFGLAASSSRRELRGGRGAAGGRVAVGGAEEAEAAASEQLAHGAAFVGRHLELHELLHSCLTNQITCVYGAKGYGKSALILEAAAYLRQRGAFPHGIFCCSLEGLRRTDRVRARLGATLHFPARSNDELSTHLAQYNCCLLILDRCEAAINASRPQFVFFLHSLLSAGVRLLLCSNSSSLLAADDFAAAHDADDDARMTTPVSIYSITLAPMSERDAALLLIELTERELDAAELLDEAAERAAGSSAPADVLTALRRHELIARLGGVPTNIQWAACRLRDTTVGALLAELRSLKPSQQARLVKADSPAAPDLAPLSSSLASPRQTGGSRRRLPPEGRASEGSGLLAGGLRVWPVEAALAEIAQATARLSDAAGGLSDAGLVSVIERLQAVFSSPAGSGVASGRRPWAGGGGGGGGSSISSRDRSPRRGRRGERKAYAALDFDGYLLPGSPSPQPRKSV